MEKLLKKHPKPWVISFKGSSAWEGFSIYDGNGKTFLHFPYCSEQDHQAEFFIELIEIVNKL